MTEFEKQVEEILQPTGLSQFEIDLAVAAVVGRHKAALRGELEWIRDVCMVRDTQAAMDVYIISRRDFKARIARLNSQEQDNE